VEELVADTDRVVVLRDGRSVAVLEGDAIDEQPILEAMATGSAAGVDGTGSTGSTEGAR
jgi:ribose transport system ATP-binding protein